MCEIPWRAATLQHPFYMLTSRGPVDTPSSMQARLPAPLHTLSRPGIPVLVPRLFGLVVVDADIHVGLPHANPHHNQNESSSAP